MSEQAKLTYIRERLKEARSRERSGAISLFIGAILVGMGFAFYPMSGTILIIIGGVILSIIGGVETFYYTYQRMKLMEQLKKIAMKITCPKCGKELLDENFMFCPFCGASLERKPES
jgi:hypothetical protein